MIICDVLLISHRPFGKVAQYEAGYSASEILEMLVDGGCDDVADDTNDVGETTDPLAMEICYPKRQVVTHQRYDLYLFSRGIGNVRY